MPEAPSPTIAGEMDDNQALREILGEVRTLDGIIRQRYDSMAAPLNAQAVSFAAPYVRDADPLIVKTVVTNVHATNNVLVYEEGALVAVLAPTETWVSPLNGAGDITVSANNGSPATAAVATYYKAEEE